MFYNNPAVYLGDPRWRYEFMQMLDKGSANTQVFRVKNYFDRRMYALKIMIKKTKLKSEYKVDMHKMEVGSM